MVSAHSKSPNWQIDLVTVTFYMVRMVMAWMTIYQKMPYIVRWRRTADDMERPDSDSNTKEAPLFQSQMNMVWCLLAMALAIVPRIFNITFFCGTFMFSSRASYCLQPYPSSNLHLSYVICFSVLAGLGVIYATALGLFYQVRFNFFQNRN